MKLHRQFLLLHERYGAEATEANGVQLTLAEVAETLDCTHRSALTVIGKMGDAGWIQWLSQRGRGKRSELVFHVTPEEIAAQSVAEAIRRGDFRGIAGELGDNPPSPTMQKRLQESLRNYFGHHSELLTNRQIDTLRLPIRQQLHALDPLRTNLLAESFVVSHLFDGLLRKENGSDQILPALAHHWESSEDSRCWTFYLRKDVSFHDGSIMTAEDVVYSFERMLKLPERVLYGFMFRNIEEVWATGPLTVKIKLKRAHTLFLPFLCTSRAAILPKDTLKRGEEAFSAQPIGTGPFRLHDLDRDLCILEAFPAHYAGRAHLDRVEIVNIPWRIQGGEDPKEETDLPFHVLPGGTPSLSSAQPSIREVTQPIQPRFDHHHRPHFRHNDQPTAQPGKQAGWTRTHTEVFSRKFVTCNTKSGPLRDPQRRAAVIAAIADLDVPELEGALPEISVPGELSPAESTEDLNLANRTSLRLLTIPQYRKDALLIRERLLKKGYACRIIIVTVDDFKGRTRLAADLILFSLIRDRDEQLRLFDLYMNVSEHTDSKTRLSVRNALRRASFDATPRGRGRELDDIERLLIASHQLHVLYETPLQTAYLPSIRGISFGSQGWIDLRTIWFPPTS
ncbi:ABC transporter substrate-binding protein [Saccharibacillus sp. JS10]|uniref:ABC transporter substrate-binding protein n=1 Tax=Saccharibacillus sp. JS10 TaxID=2950552 RepID=UPI0021096D9C|nr:ABC transporter substrate-binding protein [Saccharibacillus sp. JS10]MCQ4087957.1 ABC transporter substrate-binding protein [Saccharibacillus sp. JS10]